MSEFVKEVLKSKIATAFTAVASVSICACMAASEYGCVKISEMENVSIVQSVISVEKPFNDIDAKAAEEIVSTTEQTIESFEETTCDTTETTCETSFETSCESTESTETVYTTTTSVSFEDSNWNGVSQVPTLDGTLVDINPDLIEYLYNRSNECGVPFELTLAVCNQESTFRPHVNNAGLNSDGSVDYGLMGLNSYYLDWMSDVYNGGCPIDVYDAWSNANVGIQILSDKLDEFDGSIVDAANAYNRGSNGWKTLKASGGTWYYGEDVLEYIDILDKMNYI